MFMSHVGRNLRITVYGKKTALCSLNVRGIRAQYAEQNLRTIFSRRKEGTQEGVSPPRHPFRRRKAAVLHELSACIKRMRSSVRPPSILETWVPFPRKKFGYIAQTSRQIALAKKNSKVAWLRRGKLV